MSGLIALFLDPFAHDFMQRGLVVAILVGAACALLSCYLVLKGWSLMGDAVSHAVLPGIVVAHLLALPLALGAFAAGLGCALATGYLRDHSRVKEDAVMAIVFSGMFAAGLVAFVKIETDQHLSHILFGNMLGVSRGDVIEAALIALPVIAIVLAKRHDFLACCFDPAHAQAIGLPVRHLHYALLILLALTIVASLKAVGVILVIAMLITPGATGFVLTRRFGRMMMIAVISAIAACVIGTIASFHLDAATGPFIVVIQSAFFLAALGWALIRRRAGPRLAGQTEDPSAI
jgi:manganese/iron transport system permease protein